MKTTPRVPQITIDAVRTLLLWTTIASQDKQARDDAELLAEVDACAHVAAKHADNLRVSRNAERNARDAVIARGITI